MAAFALLAAVGCEPGHDARASGRVTLDGGPLASGAVTFHSTTGTPGYATIQSNGNYEVSTLGRPGLSSGDYVVTVISLVPPTVPTDGGKPFFGKSLIPFRYSSESTTDLKYTIKPGANNVNIQLKTK